MASKPAHPPPVGIATWNLRQQRAHCVLRGTIVSEVPVTSNHVLPGSIPLRSVQVTLTHAKIVMLASTLQLMVTMPIQIALHVTLQSILHLLGQIHRMHASHVSLGHILRIPGLIHAHRATLVRTLLLVLLPAYLASSQPAATALSDHHRALERRALWGITAWEVPVTRYLVLLPPAATALPDHRQSKEVCALWGIIARVVPMI